MAHAIHDDAVRADRGRAPRSGNARAIGAWASRRSATSTGPAAARRWLQLRHRRRAHRVQFADDRLVEAALPDGRCRRIDRSSSGLEADRPDAGAGRAHHGVDAPPAASRHDALVDAVARSQAGRAAHDCRPRVAPCRAATASTRALHAIRPIPSSRRRLRMSSASTSIRPSTPWCSASTKRQRFKRSIGWTPSCRCRPDAPNGTASSTTDTGRCRSMRR